MSQKTLDAIAKREAARDPKTAAETLTKAELVAKAEEAGVPTSGTKAEIAERLAETEK